jgi:hypothetical protein
VAAFGAYPTDRQRGQPNNRHGRNPARKNSKHRLPHAESQ